MHRWQKLELRLGRSGFLRWIPLEESLDSFRLPRVYWPKTYVNPERTNRNRTKSEPRNNQPEQYVLKQCFAALTDKTSEESYDGGWDTKKKKKKVYKHAQRTEKKKTALDKTPSKQPGHTKYYLKPVHTVVDVRAGSGETPPKFVSHECCMHEQLECHIFGIMLTATNSGRGWHSRFFCQGPRTGASAENASRPVTDLQRGQILIEAFTVGRKKMTHFFSGPAASRCSKACLHKVSRKNSKNWLRRTNIKSSLTPKIENILKSSNTMPSCDCCT